MDQIPTTIISSIVSRFLEPPSIISIQLKIYVTVSRSGLSKSHKENTFLQMLKASSQNNKKISRASTETIQIGQRIEWTLTPLWLGFHLIGKQSNKARHKNILTFFGRKR